MTLFYANINRLVEGWDIAYVEHCSLRPKPLSSSSMNLALVLNMITYINSFYLDYVCVIVGLIILFLL